MKISARNQLKGTITEILEGKVNVMVSIEIGAGNVISAMITKASAQELGLKVGHKATAVIKASSVMVGVE